MSKQEKEIAIIEGIKNLKPTGFGAYQFDESLRIIISKVMGYKMTRMVGGTINYDDRVFKIIKRMLDKNIIKSSKNGSMFRLV